MNTIAPARTLAVVIGAGSFPNHEDLSAPPSFTNSAKAVAQYFTDAAHFELPRANLLDLFDHDGSPSDQCEALATFMAPRAAAVSDVVVYYVGHGQVPEGNELCLALRSTRQKFVSASSLRVKDLASALRDSLRNHRLYIILDCCFSATAVTEFLAASALDVAVSLSTRAFPSQGTALLCATSASEVAWALRNDRYAMFSGALLDVLRNGHKLWPPRLSLEAIGSETRNLINQRHPDKSSLPQVHSPGQRGGNVAHVGLFPNPARRVAARSSGVLDAVTLEIANRQIGQLTRQVKVLQEAIRALPTTHQITEFIAHLVLDDDGSAVVERECRGITAKQSFVDLEIPYTIGVSAGDLRSIQVEKILGSKLDVDYIERVAPTSDPDGSVHVDGVVKLKGEISARTGFVGYRIRQEIGKAFCITKEEAEQAYANAVRKDEYFGNSIVFPVSLMRVTVAFPPGFNASVVAAQPVVFFGISELLNESELDRILVEGQGGFRIDGRTATFEVRNPRRGNQYAIAWQPPPASPINSADAS